MDQIRIGSFLKELRNNNNLTQEQLAEKFGVSQRSVSRWENGNTMPDISILIELADYYDVDLREILNGERKTKTMKEDLKETLVMVANYTSVEKDKIKKELTTMLAISIPLFIVLGVINALQLTRIWDGFVTVAAFCSSLGLIYAIKSLISVKQLNDQVSKTQVKKIYIVIASLGFVGILLALLLILWAVGII